MPGKGAGGKGAGGKGPPVRGSTPERTQVNKYICMDQIPSHCRDVFLPWAASVAVAVPRDEAAGMYAREDGTWYPDVPEGVGGMWLAPGLESIEVEILERVTADRRFELGFIRGPRAKVPRDWTTCRLVTNKERNQAMVSYGSVSEDHIARAAMELKPAYVPANKALRTARDRLAGHGVCTRMPVELQSESPKAQLALKQLLDLTNDLPVRLLLVFAQPSLKYLLARAAI